MKLYGLWIIFFCRTHYSLIGFYCLERYTLRAANNYNTNWYHWCVQCLNNYLHLRSLWNCFLRSSSYTGGQCWRFQLSFLPRKSWQLHQLVSFHSFVMKFYNVPYALHLTKILFNEKTFSMPIRKWNEGQMRTNQLIKTSGLQVRVVKKSYASISRMF